MASSAGEINRVCVERGAIQTVQGTVVVKTVIRGSALAAISLWCTGCLPTMWDSKLSASDERFDKLQTEAKARSWGAERSVEGSSDGLNFWYVKVNPKPDETIYFTKNNATLTIAVSCKGGRLGDDDVCRREAEDLIKATK
jgi:hypothetical protein